MDLRKRIKELAKELDLIIIEMTYENNGPYGESHWSIELDVREESNRPSQWNYMALSDIVYAGDVDCFINEVRGAFKK